MSSQDWRILRSIFRGAFAIRACRVCGAIRARLDSRPHNALGKWHLGLPTNQRDKPTPDEHGFDYCFATWNNASPSHQNPNNFIRNGKPVGRMEGYACQIVVDEAIDWLEDDREPDSPFFLNVWFHEPHAPIAAPDKIVKKYGEVDDRAAIYSGTIDNSIFRMKRPRCSIG